jgi:seryl-tRNA synthetase
MLDINLIREKPEFVKEGVAVVGGDPALIVQVLAADQKWRELVRQSEELRARQKSGSKGRPREADAAERAAQIAELRELGRCSKEIAEQADKAREELDALMLTVPNLPHPDAPIGADASQNVVVRTEGAMPQFEFEPRPHWELGETLGIINFERGVKMSGSRFYVLIGHGAQLQRALIAWMLDLHTRQHGYTEVLPPYVVSRKCLIGTGNLPKFADNLYHDAADDLWLIPTAEVPLTNLHREEVIPEEALPLHYVAYTACFRREKMSAGTDVRGIKRGHQFDKVELMKYCLPQESDREHLALLADAEDVCKGLGLPYRIVEMCTGDLSFVARRKFDIEVWAAGCGEWLEVSSVSTMGDFQARRADIRYKPRDGGRPRFVHTLNGSGLALPRVVIAVLENCQQPDGSVLVPQVLRPYMGGLERIERA